MATFEEDIQGGLREIQETYAKTATFVNGATEIPLINVVIGKRTFRYVERSGLTMHKETRDFIVETAQMNGVEPAIGNQIKQTFGGFIHTYKVVSLNNEPCFHYSDDANNTMRIHTLLEIKVPTA